MGDRQTSGEDWHAKLKGLAERFKAIAEAKPPELQFPKGVWNDPLQTEQRLLRDKAIRDQRIKYEQAVTEAGTLLIALSNSGVITDRRLRAFVAAHELGTFGGLVSEPANLFALFVGGSRIELSDDQGRIAEFETHGVRVPPSIRPAAAHPGNEIVDAGRQALGEPPPPDPDQCLRYGDFCMSLASKYEPPTSKEVKPAGGKKATAGINTEEAAAPTNASAKGMSWQNAMKMAEDHCARNPFPGVNALAKLVGCAPSTICKAIKHSPKLRVKQAEHEARRRKDLSTAMTEEVAESAVQGRESDPVEEASRRLDGCEPPSKDEVLERLMETAKPSEREKLRDMPPEKLQELIETIENDPDAGNRVRGRAK